MNEIRVEKLYTVLQGDFSIDEYKEACSQLKELSLEYRSLKNGENINTGEKVEKPSQIYAKEHRVFVNKCLSPFPKRGERKNVYIKWVDMSSIIDGGCDGTEIHLDVMTPQMLLTDYYFYLNNADWFDGERNINRRETEIFYKPWYYAFDQNEKKVFNEKIVSKLKRKVNDEYEWFEAEIYTEGKNVENEVEGNLSFCASKFEIREIFLEVKGKVQNKDLQKAIDEVDDVPNSSQISKMTTGGSAGFPDNVGCNSKAYVYNVGQANCIYIYLKNFTGADIKVFFDAGQPLPFFENGISTNTDLKGTTAVTENIDKLSHFKPDIIIISHWHYDHMMGLLTLGDWAYEAIKYKKKNNCQWIAPVPDHDAWGKYRRLLNYLIIRKKICFVDFNTSQTNSGKVWENKNKNVIIYQGNKWEAKDLNCSSLILKIKDTVFAGDCLYQYWPDELKNNINDIQNLVVPHHACELDTSNEGVLNLKTNFSNGKAIICSGYNTYSHPNNDHINLLKQKFLFVETTGGAANSNKFERININ